LFITERTRQKQKPNLYFPRPENFRLNRGKLEPEKPVIFNQNRPENSRLNREKTDPEKNRSSGSTGEPGAHP